MSTGNQMVPPSVAEKRFLNPFMPSVPLKGHWQIVKRRSDVAERGD